MTPTEAAFMQAIIATPADDAPRLIYADWLEENGQPERAEFVRVQIELAQLDDRLRGVQFGCSGHHSHGGKAGQVIHGMLHESDPRAPHHHHDGQCVDPREAPRRRERELWLDGRAFWGNLPGPLGDAANEFSWWHRGFVAAVTLTAEDWMRHADALTAAQPIEEVTLTTWPKEGKPMRPNGGNLAPAGMQAAWVSRLQGRWPTIRFHLLPEPRVIDLGPADVTVNGRRYRATNISIRPAD